MAAEGTPAPWPRVPKEAETPRELFQTPGSAAARQGESLCSEEFALDCIFAACDPEQTGTVLGRRVVEYVQAVTGRSGEQGQLRALRLMLEPEAAATALDLASFRAVMRDWIALCRQDGGSQGGEETDVAAGDPGVTLMAEGRAASAAAPGDDSNDTDAVSPSEAAVLRSRAEQLAARNAKLQRDAEAAEELSARLAEETAQLRAQLRCSQQALEQARAAAEELEDVKAAAKALEEENGELRRQARQMEKEQQGLRSRADGLCEENQRLLDEGQGLRERLRALAAETAEMEAQFCGCTELLSARDAALAQAGQRVGELTAALGEYDTTVQALRLETTQLREQLGRMRDPWDAQPWGDGDVPAQPLGTEIEASRRGSGEEEEEEEGPARDREDGDGGGGLRVPPSRRALLVLVLLGILVALVRPPRGAFPWPQLQLRHQGPPPL